MNEILYAAISRDVVEGAQRLLGARLVFGELQAEIVETEAYRAEDDPASHAYRGVTARNRVMFEGPGFAYVYFNYGVHWMLNVTAQEEGRAAAVLIRAAMPIEGIELMRQRRKGRSLDLKNRDLLSGPGKLTQAFAIDRAQNGRFLFDPTSDFRIEEADSQRSFLSGPRVGIAIGKGHETPWRFIDHERRNWASNPRLQIAGPS